MPSFCGVVGCSNRGNRNPDKKYYTLPGVRDNRGRPCPSSIHRRKMWIKALHRSDLTEIKLKYLRICSDHFTKGKPAPLNDSTDPDFIPSVNIGCRNQQTNIANIVERYGQILKQHANNAKRNKNCSNKSSNNDEKIEDHLPNFELANDDSRSTCDSETCKEKISSLNLALPTATFKICEMQCKKTLGP